MPLSGPHGHRATHFHRKLKLFLVIYVDDFKLAGPREHLAEGWRLLRTGLSIEPERGAGLYLGCNTLRKNFRLPDGRLATAVEY